MKLLQGNELMVEAIKIINIPVRLPTMMTHEEKVGYYVHQVMDSVHDRREYEDCRVFLEDCVVAVREIVKEEV